MPNAPGQCSRLSAHRRQTSSRSAGFIALAMTLAACGPANAPKSSTGAAPSGTSSGVLGRDWRSTGPGKPVRAQAYSGTVYLSDLQPSGPAENGWGPYQLDTSNGEKNPAGGNNITNPLRVGGKTYAKGLGVHANSTLAYDLSGSTCTTFSAEVGVDDEVGALGSVQFQVIVDGKVQFESGVLTGQSAAKPVSVNVTGAQTLKLTVTNGDGDFSYDHADWADAKLSCGGAPGSGTGLKAEYYPNLDLSGTPQVRTDAVVDFDFGSQAPTPALPGIRADNFSVRWSGQVLAPTTGDYTFITTSDDGLRLWVDDKLVIDNWTDHGATEDRASVRLEAGQRYNLKLEYYERGGSSMARLEWQVPGEARSVIPQSSLFPVASTTPSPPVIPPTTPRFTVEYPDKTPGVYNVRDYGAKGDGVTDDTAAIRATFDAIDRTPYSRPNADNSVVYLPDGKYLVSDTINFRQYRVMQGQSEDKTIIQLQDNASGYGAGAASKAVIRTLFSNNESFANYIRNLSVDTGRGNPGASGILYNAHNTGMMERVTVRSPQGGAVGVDLSETEFGPGMLKDVTIEGFDYGIRTPAQPSHATLANITLINQKVLGIENRFPMTLHGLTSINSVPAVVNLGGFAQLVLLDAKLTGGAADAVAIRNTGSLYLSGIQTSGYNAALENRGAVVPGSGISEFVEGERPSQAAGLPGHLDIPRATPPETPLPPVSQWAIPVDGPGDDTAAVQQAIDSGAEVIFLPYNSDYRLSETVIVRGNVREVLGMLRGGFSGAISDFTTKPMLRVQGNGRIPVTFEWTGTSTYPEANHLSLEMASNEDVYLKGHAASLYGLVTNAPGVRGRLFMDEYTASLKLSTGLLAQVRQLNTENNPFDPANPRPIPTYVQNDGARLSIMGWKTEAPALHGLTTSGGQTSVLGGFFRDFFSESVFPPFKTLPYFQTTDASLSATYFSYANNCGNTRQLHAVSTQGGNRQEIRLDDCSHAVSLYSTRP